MKYIKIANSDITVPEIGLGCMRMNSLTKNEISHLVNTALEQGINFFDHSNIYGGNGKCEEVFADGIDMNDNIREKMIIQTKCGIRNGYYDSSKEHILESVDQSLKRLKTDYIDILLIHRPDPLVEPEEVAEAFSKLKRSGKVRYFGVSNHNPMQIELLNKYLNNKLIINQLQFSIMNTGMIDSGINVNTKFDAAFDRDGSVLDYCRLKDITVQAWSPFQYGFIEGIFLDNDKFPEVNKKLAEIAKAKNSTKTAISIAWILRHPAKIQPIVGTMNPNRLKEICTASNVKLTKIEWYDIYKSAGNRII